MFVTSASTSLRPSRSAACFLTAAHVPIPSVPSGELSYVWPAGSPPSSLPLEIDAGLVAPNGVVEGATAVYSRRKAWWDACEVYVWLWSTQGESVLLASCTSS